VILWSSHDASNTGRRAAWLLRKVLLSPTFENFPLLCDEKAQVYSPRERDTAVLLRKIQING
jgi:hypothetical protein